MKLRENCKKGAVWGHLVKIDLVALIVTGCHSPTEEMAFTLTALRD